MDAKLIRNKFLEFFNEKGHQIVPSAPLVVKDDPTLMFTNAGMNQFKDFFLGTKQAPYKRAADTQKCLRVSGKHNDLEEVGFDTYHHTMFEMLGNWSFGDYFKKEAIDWAWELLTEVYGLDKDRLYASIFEGDASENLEMDQEAFDLWKGIIGEERIIMGSKKDNFWEMGDTGPCGPCSELHIDLRSEKERKEVDGKSLVNMDHPQVVEVWNLVFMQYNRKADRSLENLPQRHVDTGMGFERLCMAIQAQKSNYDTDVFTPLIASIAKDANKSYGKDDKTDIAMRVIADHVRAISFAICDGQLPSNTGAGYVIRRILRRGVRYGFTFLGHSTPFIYKLVEVLAAQFDSVFPELKSQKDFVKNVIEQEEKSFLKTLENGLKRLEVITNDLDATNEKVINGKVAFELYDTFGFPFDLTSLIAREGGRSVDEAGFNAEMLLQKERSKADAEKETGDWIVLQEVDGCEFVGYALTQNQSFVTRHRTIKQKGKDLFQLVLAQTAFYAESGGQVGDTGYLEFESGEKISVVDTKKENDLIVHLVNKLPGNFEGNVKAFVNTGRRRLIQSNHSATHLLHAALREVLGAHVEQKGSLVNDKVLRFDFSHFQKMEAEEIKQVEKIVNEKIRANIALEESRNVPIEQAKEMGAMALFGEKYGDFVRVITFDKNYSVELCGGIHVTSTAQIGLFKITSESSIAAGVRRIEAISGAGTEQLLMQQETVLSELHEVLKAPKNIAASVKSLVDENSQLKKELEKLYSEQAQIVKKELLDNVNESNGVNFIIQKVSIGSADALKNIAFALKNQLNDLVMVVAADIGGKPQVAVVISDSLVAAKNWHAGKIVKELAQEIKGGGGGQAFFATAGGKDINGLDNVIKKAAAFFDN